MAHPIDRLVVKFTAAPLRIDECDCEDPQVSFCQAMYPFRDMTMQACASCRTMYILPEATAATEAAWYALVPDSYLVHKHHWNNIAAYIYAVDQARSEGYVLDGSDLEEMAISADMLDPHELTEKDPFPCGPGCECFAHWGEGGRHIGETCYRPKGALALAYATINLKEESGDGKDRVHNTERN